MLKRIISFFIGMLMVNAYHAQHQIKRSTINCYGATQVNGGVSPNLNARTDWAEIGIHPDLFKYVTLYEELSFNERGQVESEKSENYEYSYSYYDDGSLDSRIFHYPSSPSDGDTILYVYNDHDSIGYTVHKPILEKSVYYFDENGREIPWSTYDYTNDKHIRKELSRIVLEVYEYGMEDNKLRSKTKGEFEFEAPNKIGKMLKPLSEVTYTYYPDGAIQKMMHADVSGIYTLEWSEDGVQQTSIMRPKGSSPQYVSIYHYDKDKINKIESMTFPYQNYPTGIKSEHESTEFIYNDQKLLAKVIHSDQMASKKTEYDFKYTLNDNKDWIQKEIYVNGAPKFVEVRTISYFNE